MHDLVHIRDDIGTYKIKFANKAKQPDIITLLYYNLHVHIKVKCQCINIFLMFIWSHRFMNALALRWYLSWFSIHIGVDWHWSWFCVGIEVNKYIFDVYLAT